MSKKEYRLIDEDENEIVLEFVISSCHCSSPACVDDEIRLDERDGDAPYIASIPKVISSCLMGILDGDYKIKHEESKNE